MGSARIRVAVLCVACLNASVATAEPSGRLPVLWERLVEILPSAVALIDRLRVVSPAPLPSQRILARCSDRVVRASAACARDRPVERIGCAGVFARAFRTLSAARHPAAPFAEGAEEASRVSLLLHRIAREGCAPSARAEAVPAVLALVDGGAALRIEPASPLASSRAHHLWFGRTSRAGRTSNDMAEPAGLREAMPPTAPQFLGNLYAAAERAAGVTVRPRVLVAMPETLTLSAARRSRIEFRRGPTPASGGTSTAFRTVASLLLDDARRASAAGRKTARAGEVRVVPAASADPASMGIAGTSLPHVARYVVGRFVSRDVETGRASRVPFLVTAPAGPVHAVVVLLHGLGGRSTAFLARRADDLAERGLAAASFDLPYHGDRETSTAFLDTLDPAAFAVHLRQARIDGFAFTTALRTALPGVLPAGTPVRLLGYSLGGMVGAQLLAGDPDIDAAVLVAPAGDLFDFVGLRVAESLGLPLVTCAGGANEGAACAAGEPCPDGVCAPNPHLYPFARIATPYRTVVADVDPQTEASHIAGRDGRRPVLIQEGDRDYIIHNANTAWLAAGMGADMTCALRAGAPQTLCHFRGAAHDLVNIPVAQAQAHTFLASGGRTLVDGGDARAAR